MSTRRTRTYTRRADAMDSTQSKRDRLKRLKSMQQQLTPEQLAELQKLMQEIGDA